MSTGIDDSSLPTAAPAPVPPPKPNPWARIVGVFIAPNETFRSIAERPTWVAPFVLLLVMTTIGAFIASSHIDMAGSMRAQMEQQNPNMTPQQLERAMKIGTFVAKAAAFFAPIAALIALVVIAAILLVAVRMFGGQGEFRAAFGVTAHAWMPFIVLSVITWIVLAVKGTVSIEELQVLVRSNLGFLASPKTQPLLFVVLSAIDAFTIWVMALLVIGFSEVSKLSRGKVAAVVVTLWALLLLIKVAFAGIGVMMKARRAA